LLTFGWLSEFNDARVHAALQQKLAVLVNAVVVHATAWVPRVLVIQIQRVMFIIEMQVQDPGMQILVGKRCTALTAVRLEVRHEDTQGLAGLASIAVGPVCEQSTAAKALRDQV
jgi:hypothetical protein